MNDISPTSITFILFRPLFLKRFINQSESPTANALLKKSSLGFSFFRIKSSKVNVCRFPMLEVSPFSNGQCDNKEYQECQKRITRIGIYLSIVHHRQESSDPLGEIPHRIQY